MNSFLVRAVNYLARNPETVTDGKTIRTRFCLIGHDYAGRDDAGATAEIVTAVWFEASGPIGKSIWRHCRKGDPLIVESTIRNTGSDTNQSVKHPAYNFVVVGVLFGAHPKANNRRIARLPSTDDSSTASSQ